MDGVQKKYYENGQLNVEVTYKDGEPVGTAKKYDENGHLQETQDFKDGAPIEP